MKKEVIIEALKDAGVEIEEAQLKEFIKKVQIANGEDIENAKKDYAEKEQALADLQAKYDSEVALKKEQEQNLDNVNSELLELRKFKKDTIENQTRAVREEAISKVVGDEKYKFDKKAIKLLCIASKDKFNFNENNEITNADEVMTALQNEYADYIVESTTTGVTPTPNTSSSDVDVNKMSFEEYKAYQKSQGNL